VPADYPDEADDHPDRNDAPPAATNPARPTNPEPDFSARQEAYTSLRLALSAEQTTAAHQATAADRAAYQKWTKDAAHSRALWSEYQHHWPETERPVFTRPEDPQGSWRGDGERYLEPEDNQRVEEACDRIADRERNIVSPAMLEIEAQDPTRTLAGFDRRLKDHERIKEKVFDRIEEKNRSPEEVVFIIPDLIRYTLQYEQSRYTQGVWADLVRMKDCGFELMKLKNFWSDDQYKGINSQWCHPETGQRFEVQFHTRISFEAKGITHEAYKRLRSGKPEEFEKIVLKALQQEVSGKVPIPPGATDISDYPERT
jgi:hypothetical protein